MGTLSVSLINAAIPIIAGIIRDHQVAHGTTPTDEEIAATFNANVDRFLAEGQAWLASHPEP